MHISVFVSLVCVCPAFLGTSDTPLWSGDGRGRKKQKKGTDKDKKKTKTDTKRERVREEGRR